MIDIRTLHYAFVNKVGAVDSNLSREFIVPEIDWLLNKGLRAFILENIPSPYGVDDVRSVEALQPLIVRVEDAQLVESSQPNRYTYTLPSDYFALFKAQFTARKCNKPKVIRGWLVSQDDAHTDDPFAESSYEWEEVNIEIESNKLVAYTDSSFTLTNMKELVYIKDHPYMHYAEGFGPNGYVSTDGTPLAGKQDCLLDSTWALDRIVMLAINELSK